MFRIILWVLKICILNPMASSIYICISGVDHLLYDGAMGLLHHADPQGLQDTQRRCLVQHFLPLLVAVVLGQFVGLILNPDQDL